MFLIILMILVPYLIVGTALARRDYAQRVTLAGTRDTMAQIATKRKQLKAIKHTSDCWRGSIHRSTDRNCDCKHRLRWKNLSNQIETLEADGIVVDGPYKMLFGWPVLGFDAFLKNGSVSQPKALLPKDWEQKMERELLDLNDEA